MHMFYGEPFLPFKDRTGLILAVLVGDSVRPWIEQQNRVALDRFNCVTSTIGRCPFLGLSILQQRTYIIYRLLSPFHSDLGKTVSPPCLISERYIKMVTSLLAPLLNWVSWFLGSLLFAPYFKICMLSPCSFGIKLHNDILSSISETTMSFKRSTKHQFLEVEQSRA